MLESKASFLRASAIQSTFISLKQGRGCVSTLRLFLLLSVVMVAYSSLPLSTVNARKSLFVFMYVYGSRS